MHENHFQTLWLVWLIAELKNVGERHWTENEVAKNFWLCQALFE